MAEKIKPYAKSNLDKKTQVEQMFDIISGEYDQLNRVISFGVDLRWRKKVVRMVAQHGGDKLLDIATGTGDLAIAFAKKTEAAEIIGLDLSQGMLNQAVAKVKDKAYAHRLKFIKGDSEALSFESNYFDAISVSFGVRNFEHLEQGLSEIYRVLKPGGLLVILETSVPDKFPFKQGYRFYTNGIMPTIGRWLSKDKLAYRYLSDSASAFPYGQNFNNILSQIGFIVQRHRPQTFGVATIYNASK